MIQARYQLFFCTDTVKSKFKLQRFDYQKDWVLKTQKYLRHKQNEMKYVYI